MRTWHSIQLLIVVLASALALSCSGPKRFRDVAKKDDDRTEGQVVGERHLKLAAERFDVGDTAGAQAKYLEALRSDPMLFKAHMGLGDIYELEGDIVSSRVEYAAHTEIAPKAKHYLDRMFDYVFAKYSRRPTSVTDIPKEDRADSLLLLSEAVALYRGGKKDAALAKIPEVLKHLPRTGLPEWFEGMVLLSLEQNQKALEAFERSVRDNPYFIRCLLNDRIEEKIPSLLPTLASVLDRDLKTYPSDIESAFLLGAIRLRLGAHQQALAASKHALAWGKPRWDILLLKARALDLQGEKVQMEQALADLRSSQPDVSGVFPTYEPSVFRGVMAGQITDFAKAHFPLILGEPERSYFLWRLSEERGDGDAGKHRDTFFEQLRARFPADEFALPPTAEKPEREPKSVHEFMGMVQEKVESRNADFLRCDATCRKLRAVHSGRIVFRVSLSREGKVAQVAIEENTTSDRWLAYCVVRKLLALSFPRPLRANESFQLPVFFGPETDGGPEKKAPSGTAAGGDER